MRTHGGLTERSLNDHIGKGREGKGREIGRESVSHGCWLSGPNQIQVTVAYANRLGFGANE